MCLWVHSTDHFSNDQEFSSSCQTASFYMAGQSTGMQSITVYHQLFPNIKYTSLSLKVSHRLSKDYEDSSYYFLRQTFFQQKKKKLKGSDPFPSQILPITPERLRFKQLLQKADPWLPNHPQEDSILGTLGIASRRMLLKICQYPDTFSNFIPVMDVQRPSADLY